MSQHALEKTLSAEAESAHSPLKTWGLIGGAALFALMLGSDAPEGLSKEGWNVLAVAILMGIWWMTEAIPIAATGMVPLIAFPFLGLGSITDAGKGFTSKAVFLPLGGFILGIALQRWNLHERIALLTVRLVGTSPKRVIAGFMLATAFLSMWITNTATTVMMLPIAYSVAMLLINEGDGSQKDKRAFGICLMIGIAYAASMGGMMTLVGTSTNVMFKGFMEAELGIEIGFAQWMMLAVPIALTLMALIWYGLCHIIFPCRLAQHDGVATLIHDKLAALGKMSAGEWRTLLVFAITACCWIFRKPIDAALPGISLNDASIAIAAAVALFMLPSGEGKNEPERKGEKLLTWADTKEVPWGILLMLGGGISLAGFMNSTGVASWMGGQLGILEGIPYWVLLLVITGAIIFLSELMSNVATLTAFLPVIIGVSLAFGQDPLLLAVPAALAASCAFMLPIATPPNAIVFGSGLLSIKDMVRAGVIYNLLALLIINALCALLIPMVYQ